MAKTWSVVAVVMEPFTGVSASDMRCFKITADRCNFTDSGALVFYNDSPAEDQWVPVRAFAAGSWSALELTY